LSSANFWNASLPTFFLDGRECDLLFAQNLTKGFAIVCDTLADNDLVQSVAAFENVGRHKGELQRLDLSLHRWTAANGAGLGIWTWVLFIGQRARVETSAAIDQFTQLINIRRT